MNYPPVHAECCDINTFFAAQSADLSLSIEGSLFAKNDELTPTEVSTQLTEECQTNGG